MNDERSKEIKGLLSKYSLSTVLDVISISCHTRAGEINEEEDGDLMLAEVLDRVGSEVGQAGDRLGIYQLEKIG